MIKNELEYLKEYYKQMKDQEELYIVNFSPKRIELSSGETLRAPCGGEFDQNIVEDILDYNRRTHE